MSKKHPSIMHRHLWPDDSLPWLEEDIQIAVAEYLYKQENALGNFTFAADMNAGRRSKSKGARAKAAGMRKGETDLRFYMHGGRLGLIELKAKKTAVDKDQKARHALLRSLGFDVRIVRATCPADGIEQVSKILGEWL